MRSKARETTVPGGSYDRSDNERDKSAPNVVSVSAALVGLKRGLTVGARPVELYLVAVGLELQLSLSSFPPPPPPLVGATGCVVIGSA